MGKMYFFYNPMNDHIPNFGVNLQFVRLNVFKPNHVVQTFGLRVLGGLVHLPANLVKPVFLPMGFIYV